MKKKIKKGKSFFDVNKYFWQFFVWDEIIWGVSKNFFNFQGLSRDFFKTFPGGLFWFLASFDRIWILKKLRKTLKIFDELFSDYLFYHKSSLKAQKSFLTILTSYSQFLLPKLSIF